MALLKRIEAGVRGTVEGNQYNNRGLIFGEPGTADWIKTEGARNKEWTKRHILLSLGALSAYEDKYGLDQALEEEKATLKALLKEIDYSFDKSVYKYYSIYGVGRTHIN